MKHNMFFNNDITTLPTSLDHWPSIRNFIIPSMDEVVPFIFQFPPTKNLLFVDIMISKWTHKWNSGLY